MPVFWLGLMLVYVFAFKLDLFPTSGRLSTGIELERITNLYVVDSVLTGQLAGASATRCTTWSCRPLR